MKKGNLHRNGFYGFASISILILPKQIEHNVDFLVFSALPLSWGAAAETKRKDFPFKQTKNPQLWSDSSGSVINFHILKLFLELLIVFPKTRGHMYTQDAITHIKWIADEMFIGAQSRD